VARLFDWKAGSQEMKLEGQLQNASTQATGK
jgi:hypothetical protein